MPKSTGMSRAGGYGQRTSYVRADNILLVPNVEGFIGGSHLEFCVVGGIPDNFERRLKALRSKLEIKWGVVA